MRYKVCPADFIVEEQVRPRFVPAGAFAVYRVRKRGITTLQLQAQLARMLGITQTAVVCPALKDKRALAVQHVSIRGGGPPHLVGKGFEAHLLGHTERPLTPSDVLANRFTITVRDLSPTEVSHIQRRAEQISQFGLPNYFDEQRFGSHAREGEHIGKHILRRDAASALRAYLTLPFVGDTAEARKFKAFAAAQWGDWERLFGAAPRPSNYRSILTYLRDHPAGGEHEYRKALNLITPRLLSLYLAGYQSMLWNRIGGRYLVALLGECVAYGQLEVADERLPIYYRLPAQVDRGIAIQLPNHRAVYTDRGLSAIVAHVLAEEGLTLQDLKARILKKAYLPKGKRALFLFPRQLEVSEPTTDERFPGRSKLTLQFTLPRGSYATLVVKALAV
ncbi:MAG: tRNA pseudouridine(13) synthase TruD [Anaerolineae bacterium]|nr:tRNA pseudouridine(13) synthase TruD [Anaerolineae bacterium]